MGFRQLCVLGLALASLLGGDGVHAVSVNVDPASISTVLPAGKSEVKEVWLENNDEKAVTLKVYLEDWAYTGTGAKKQFLAVAKRNRSIAPQVRLLSQRVTLAPHQKKAFYFDLVVPKDAIGGYSGVLFFESEPLASVLTSPVKVVTRTGVLLFQDVAGTVERSLDVTVHNPIITNHVGTIFVSAKNTGNAHIRTTGSLVLVNGISKEPISRQVLASIFVLPGDTREFNVTFNADTKVPVTGIFTFDIGSMAPVSKIVSLVKQ